MNKNAIKGFSQLRFASQISMTIIASNIGRDQLKNDVYLDFEHLQSTLQMGRQGFVDPCDDKAEKMNISNKNYKQRNPF